MNMSIGSDTVVRIPSSFENISLGMLLGDVNLTQFINMSMDNMVENITFRLENTDNIVNKRDSMAVVVPVTVCYVIIFIAGVLGNVITCTVISRNKSMHTATNYYLFNLAVSDLLLLISGMPHDAYNIWFPASYPLNQSFCILQGLLSETSTNATVLTITSFTVERYIAICHPFRQHTMSKLSRAIKFIMAIWIVAFCLAIPQAIQFGIVNLVGGRSCTVKNVLVEHAFEVSSFLFFVGPMTLICVLYVLIGIKLRKSKLLQGVKRRNCEFGRGITGQTRVIRMLIAVAVAFFLCWAPFHAQRIMAVYGKATRTRNELFHDIYMILTYVSGVLYFMSTCINPLLYSIMSHKFRDAFKSTLARHFGLRTDHYHKNHTYSALSKCHGNASIRLTAATANRQCDEPHIQKQESDLSILDRDTFIKCKCTNQSCRPKCILLCSQSTVLSSVSKNDILGTSNKHIDGIKVISLGTEKNVHQHHHNQNFHHQKRQFLKQQQQRKDQPLAKTNFDETKSHHKTLNTIAEKFRRSTKKVFLFNNASLAQPVAKEEQLQKIDSIDSAHTNTISNSSLQEVDDDEFDSAELAKFMGEINKEIR